MDNPLSDPVLEVRMSEMQRACLEVLFAITQPDGTCCVPFAPIERDTGLSRRDVRRSVRALARKGLAEFHFPLWSEDGEPRGSGYCISTKGGCIMWKQETEEAVRQLEALRAGEKGNDDE